jgi:hypothetical protein
MTSVSWSVWEGLSNMLTMNSIAVSLSRLGLGAPALALGLTMASSLGGCELDRRATGGPSDGGMGGEGGMTVTDGGGGMGGDGGEGGMGSVLITGSQYVPAPFRPLDAAILSPTRAIIQWQNAETPAGRTFDSYEFCRTTGPSSEIDDASECPNGLLLPDLFQVLNPLDPDTTYRWKVRARYDGGYYSEWSAVRVFSTDHSLVGWWWLDGNANDSSAHGHTGSLQNGAAYAAGRINQALSLDGTNDFLNVPSSADFDFASGDFTLSAWVRPARNGVNESFIAKRDMTNSGYELYRSATGQLIFFTPAHGSEAVGPVLPTGEWHRIGASRTGGMVRLFVDGVPVSMGASPDSFANGAALTIGCNGVVAGCTEQFQGLMDDVIVRNAASSDAQLLNDYCADQALAGIDPLPTVCLP